MRSRTRVTFTATATGDLIPDAGIYTWDIGKNLVFADAALADLFGLDPLEVAYGLPIETYLDRIHLEDRVDLAKVIRATIITQTAQQSIYRVKAVRGPTERLRPSERLFATAGVHPYCTQE